MQTDQDLDLQHRIWLLILDEKLSAAPIGEPKTALDIGTGTGIWAKHFARQHPNTKVIGTDLSLIQHQANMPPNLTFEREDSEEAWVFDHRFEYIHWRMSTFQGSHGPYSNHTNNSMHSRDKFGAVKCANDWYSQVFTCFTNIKGMFTRIFDHLEPGGWAEFQDAEM